MKKLRRFWGRHGFCDFQVSISVSIYFFLLFFLVFCSSFCSTFFSFLFFTFVVFFFLAVVNVNKLLPATTFHSVFYFHFFFVEREAFSRLIVTFSIAVKGSERDSSRNVG